MPLTIPKSTLSALVSATHAMAGPGPIEATKYAFISVADGALSFKATNAINWLATSTPTEGTLDPIQVDAAKLQSILTPLRGEVITLSTKDNKLTLKSKEGGTRTLAGITMPYPQPTAVTGPVLTLQTARLREALAFVKSSASDDVHQKPHLCGIHIHSTAAGEYKAVAAYAAGVSAITLGEGVEDVSLTIANETVRYLQLISADTVTLTIGERGVQFDWDGGSLRGQRVELAFVDYQRSVPPEGESWLSVRAGELNECINALAPVSASDISSGSQIMRLSLASDAVALTGNAGPNSGDQPMDAEWAGPDMVVGFISKRMKAALEGFGDDELRIDIAGPEKPIVVRSVTRGNRVSVLMPVRC